MSNHCDDFIRSGFYRSSPNQLRIGLSSTTGGINFVSANDFSSARYFTVEPSSALKKFFGYDQFRPLQEQIIADALAGRDVFALMPTGGGKSLCFQLPALLREGLTIVVSPLISLMKDQVDALQASGIAATFLNSALDRHEAVEALRGLKRGECRLFYVAPERLMLD